MQEIEFKFSEMKNRLIGETSYDARNIYSRLYDKEGIQSIRSIGENNSLKEIYIM